MKHLGTGNNREQLPSKGLKGENEGTVFLEQRKDKSHLTGATQQNMAIARTSAG